jgi:hypothetical protein
MSNVNTNKVLEYQKISFNGLALNPCFSIYLFEVEQNGESAEKFFYVGMTGDSHYPSARSILHRLGGHIDLGKRSTQSQFIKALKEKVFRKEAITEEDLASIQINLHHWPIPGFTHWDGDKQNLDKESIKYKEYKKHQKAVLKLENKIIFDFKDRLMNETKGVKYETIENENFELIYEQVKKLIEG